MKLEHLTGWEDYICPHTDYDPTRIELAIDCKTAQAVVRARIGEALFINSQGVLYARDTKEGVKFFIHQEPAEA
jgi:hypothetical protein